MPSSDSWRWRKHRILAVCFAALCGYVDVISFIRYHAFATVCTGNTILLVRAVFDRFDPETTKELGLSPDLHARFYAIVLLSFNVGTVIFYLVDKKFPNRGGVVLAPFMAFLLPAFDVLRINFETDAHHKEWPCVSVMCMSLVFGCINGLQTTGSAVTYNAVTGHYSKLSLGIATLIRGECDRNFCHKTMLSVYAIVGFASGGCLGALMCAYGGWWLPYALLPAGPILALFVVIHDHLRQRLSISKGWMKKNKSPDEIESGLVERDALEEADEEESEETGSDIDGEYSPGDKA